MIHVAVLQRQVMLARADMTGHEATRVVALYYCANILTAIKLRCKRVHDTAMAQGMTLDANSEYQRWSKYISRLEGIIGNLEQFLNAPPEEFIISSSPDLGFLSELMYTCIKFGVKAVANTPMMYNEAVANHSATVTCSAGVHGTGWFHPITHNSIEPSMYINMFSHGDISKWGGSEKNPGERNVYFSVVDAVLANTDLARNQAVNTIFNNAADIQTFMSLHYTNKNTWKKTKLEAFDFVVDILSLTNSFLTDFMKFDVKWKSAVGKIANVVFWYSSLWIRPVIYVIFKLANHINHVVDCTGQNVRTKDWWAGAAEQWTVTSDLTAKGVLYGLVGQYNSVPAFEHSLDTANFDAKLINSARISLTPAAWEDDLTVTEGSFLESHWFAFLVSAYSPWGNFNKVPTANGSNLVKSLGIVDAVFSVTTQGTLVSDVGSIQAFNFSDIKFAVKGEDYWAAQYCAQDKYVPTYSGSSSLKCFYNALLNVLTPRQMHRPFSIISTNIYGDSVMGDKDDAPPGVTKCAGKNAYEYTGWGTQKHKAVLGTSLWRHCYLNGKVVTVEELNETLSTTLLGGNEIQTKAVHFSDFLVGKRAVVHGYGRWLSEWTNK